VQVQRGLPQRVRRTVMLPGRQNPIWLRAASIAALACAVLSLSGAGIAPPWPGSRKLRLTWLPQAGVSPARGVCECIRLQILVQTLR
jgi:hypothetical protein